MPKVTRWERAKKPRRRGQWWREARRRWAELAPGSRARGPAISGYLFRATRNLSLHRLRPPQRLRLLRQRSACHGSRLAHTIVMDKTGMASLIALVTLKPRSLEFHDVATLIFVHFLEQYIP